MALESIVYLAFVIAIVALAVDRLSVDLRRPPDIGVWRKDYHYLKLTPKQLYGLYDGDDG